ncbi:MAG: molybdopterin converting factor subunit 1 [Gammaproteobacteria bacterium]|nr:molybdopterin converting factor subunit 1 [Gammaproteobacteria bacterium]MDH5777701.1 molybdopterin converting factor subunit 1 [Gammaproteobacteria bacterium]
MSIQVKFFASLREQLQIDEIQIQADQAGTVMQVWQQATNSQAIPANLLCAINMEYVGLEHAVVDGDEVAFFPPVTGG